MYSGIPLIRTPLGKVFLLVRFPHSEVEMHARVVLGAAKVSCLERCRHFRHLEHSGSTVWMFEQLRTIWYDTLPNVCMCS